MPGAGWWIMFYRVLSGRQRAPVGANKVRPQESNQHKHKVPSSSLQLPFHYQPSRLIFHDNTTIMITSSVEAGIVGGQVLSYSLLFRATVQELIKLALSKYLKLSLS